MLSKKSNKNNLQSKKTPKNDTSSGLDFDKAFRYTKQKSAN